MKPTKGQIAYAKKKLKKYELQAEYNPFLIVLAKLQKKKLKRMLAEV